MCLLCDIDLVDYLTFPVTLCLHITYFMTVSDAIFKFEFVPLHSHITSLELWVLLETFGFV